ncbi:MAG TPA: tRNA-binding protein [Actinomycetota bacterium]|nr:tRNA-binding protein [Actinomycetota bacterium]
MPRATIEDLERLDIRAGTVVRCEPFPEARNPAYKVWIDFGPEIGVKASSARITDLYEPGELVGRQVLGVVNLPARQVGPFRSQVLTLGVYTEREMVVLVQPDRPVPNGARLG